MSSAAPSATTAHMAGGVPKEAQDHTLSSAAPASTTAQLAGQVPKEERGDVSQIPGAFPKTPAIESEDSMANQNTAESQPKVLVSPDEKSNMSTSHDIENFKQKEDGTSQYGVKPIPATPGIGNPIQLEPGQQVPDSNKLTQNTVQSTVKTDQQSYSKGDAGPPQLGPVVTPEVERNAKGDMFGIGPVIGTIIPESSIPMGGGPDAGLDPGVNVKSADPQSTTTALAAQVPKEPRAVPQIVKDSQDKSDPDHVAATAASSDMLQAKKELGKDIDSKVPTEPPASEGAAEKAGSVNKAGQTSEGIAAGVPPVVGESITQAHESPEAATNAEAVQEKKAVESEILKEVKPVDVSGEPAPTTTAATSATAPISTGTNENSKEAIASSEKKQFSEKATKSDEEKQPVLAASKPNEPQKPATIPSSAAVAANPEPRSIISAAPDSRDVSPMSKPVAKVTDANKPASDVKPSPAAAPVSASSIDPKITPASQPAPQGTVATAATPSSSKTKDSIDSPTATSESPAADKKSKRRSIFGRVKDKIKHF